MEYREAARIFYDAYWGVKGWQSGGRAVMGWDSLPEEEKDAYREGVRQAFQKGWTEAAPPPRRTHRAA